MQIRKGFVFAAVFVLVCTFGVIMFFEKCWVVTSRMDRLVISYDDRELVIPIAEGDYRYKFDMPLYKQEPLDGVLVMKSGKVYDVRYDPMYDSFVIEDRYGYYVNRNMY